MTNERLSRTAMLVGTVAIDALKRARVALFGAGGVGGYAIEVLARSGVGAIDIIDNDIVEESNINRQLVALTSTVGHYKADVAVERVKDINPLCEARAIKLFYLPSTAEQINLSNYSYIVDCIDTMAAKIDLVRRCHEAKVPIISCMGAANKMEPTAMRVTDISATLVDPMAKIMRKKLRSMGIEHLKVVFSDEKPIYADDVRYTNEAETKNTRPIPASNAFVPAAAGIAVGAEVVKDLIGWNKSYGTTTKSRH